MRRGIGRLRAATSGSGTDADAAAWASAATANGGTYDAATVASMSTFVKALKAAGVWTKINRINLFAGNDLAAALVPLKQGGGSATETNTNFVGGDYSLSTGLTGNGTNKVLNTGLSILSLTKSDFGMGVWQRTTTDVGSKCLIGSSYSATGATDRFYVFDSSIAGSGEIGMGAVSLAAGFTAAGMLSAETTGTTTVKSYLNGVVSLNTGTWNNDGFQAGTVTVFNGAGSFFTAASLNGYYVGNNLDQAALTSAWSTFNTAVGR